MQMQEPEQVEQSEQASQGYSGERVNYSEGYESDREQKIYPQKARWLDGTVLAIFAIIFSAIGFFLTIAGIVASAIVLQFAHGQHMMLVGGLIGLFSSIGAMLICVAIFVIAVVTLALRTRRAGRRRRM